MTFVHPWAIWGGIAAAAIPIAVHLLTRPRPVRMPLSTIRFVREAIRQRRARHVLRDAVVLALRTLAILAAALAIARPQFGAQPPVSDQQTGDTVRVVILDVSQSMAATDHATQLIERARARAEEHLRYRPGLWANLILAGAAPRAVFDQPSTNFDALREELGRSAPLPQRLDARRALQKAAQLLAPSSEEDSRRRELVVISDFQRSSWTSADFSPLPEGTKIQTESVAPPEPLANLAILRAECRSPHLGGRIGQLIVEVGNFSHTARPIEVEVTLGPSSWRLSGTCEAGGRLLLSDEIPLPAAGWHWGEARLVGVDDALAADNVRPLVVRVSPPPVYALLTRQLPQDRPSSSHFLECALLPDGKKNAATSGKVVRIDPASASAKSFAAADLIAIDHPGKLSEDTVAALAGLLRRGRPVLYVAGELVDAMNLKQLAEKAGAELRMPVEFSPPAQGQFRRELFLTSVRRDDAPFRVFGDGLDAVLGTLRFGGGLSSRRLPAALESDLLATYNDGTACLVTASAGQGTLAVVNADLSASTLPKTAAFVPLMAELVDRMLDHHRSADGAICGEQFVASLEGEAGAASGLHLVAAEGQATAAPDAAGRLSASAAEPLGELVDEGAATLWRWTSPARPGVYRVARGNDTVYAVAAQIPPSESNLQSLPPEQLEKIAAGRDIFFRAAGEGDSRDDLWTWFAVACVLCLVGELSALLGFRV